MWDDVRMTDPSVFLAYGSSHALTVEAMQTAARRLTEAGVTTTTWEDLSVDGAILIQTIMDAIDRADCVVGEISDLNSNVLFEIGYALGSNKSLILAYDETRESSNRNWNALKLAMTIGRTEYTGDGHKLADKIISSDSLRDQSGLAVRLIAGARDKLDDGVFAPTPLAKIQPVETLSRFLVRKSNITLLAASEELVIAPLEYYTQAVYRSTAAILHLLGPDRRNALGHNARLSLLAGFAQALGIRTLMVAEADFNPPLDYADLLFRYTTAAELVQFVEGWLDTSPAEAPSRRNLGRLQLQTKLPVKTFGQYVAEDEVSELADYFVNTAEFEKVISNQSSLFLGRKGTGKTATMTQAVAELSKDRRNLVVTIKPSSYELHSLLDLLRGVGISDREYFLNHLWRHLILTEIAQRVVSKAEEKAAGVSGSPTLEALQRTLKSLGLDEDGDMASRLDSLYSKIGVLGTETGWRETMSRALKVSGVRNLEVDLRAALAEYSRVAVVIDNLDKGWEPGADFEIMAQFIFSLLVVRGQVAKQLAATKGASTGINTTVSLFLRTDIYDALAQYGREPDKIGAVTVRWEDQDQLVRVIEERYSANSRRQQDRGSMWTKFFCQEVRGLPTRDYLLWRTLPRPRDLIYFANEALTVATNRGHSLVEPDDLVFAERQYSRFACEALYVESVAQEWDIEEVCFEFAGLQATTSKSRLDTMLDCFDRSEELQLWLIQTSFLGIEVDDNQFEYVEGSKDARRIQAAAMKWRQAEGASERLRVHPAFRADLRVRDDDLHVTDSLG